MKGSAEAGGRWSRARCCLQLHSDGFLDFRHKQPLQMNPLLSTLRFLHVALSRLWPSCTVTLMDAVWHLLRTFQEDEEEKRGEAASPPGPSGAVYVSSEHDSYQLGDDDLCHAPYLWRGRIAALFTGCEGGVKVRFFTTTSYLVKWLSAPFFSASVFKVHLISCVVIDPVFCLIHQEAVHLALDETC